MGKNNSKQKTRAERKPIIKKSQQMIDTRCNKIFYSYGAMMAIM